MRKSSLISIAGIFAAASVLTSALEVIPSEETIFLEFNRSGSVSCVSDEAWRWCFWEHSDSEVEYQTTSQHEKSNKTDEGISAFAENEVECGLKFDAVKREDGGRWKCHVSDTDRNGTTAVAEDYVEIRVTRETKALLKTSSVESDLQIGSPLEIECKLSEDVDWWWPPAEVSITAGDDDDLAVTVMGPAVLTSPEESLELKREVGLEDEGRKFRCSLIQKSRENGDVFYEFATESVVVANRVIVPPTKVESDDGDDYVAFPAENEYDDDEEEEGNNTTFPLLTFRFTANPAPEYVAWTIYDGFDVEDDSARGSLLSGNENESFDARELVFLDLGEVEAGMEVKNITANVTIVATAETEFGNLNETFFVVYSPLGIGESAASSVTKAGLSNNAIIGITCVLVLLIIIILVFSICATKSARRGQTSKAESKKKKKKHDKDHSYIGVDLDEVPDNRFKDMSKHIQGADFHRAHSEDHPDFSVEDDEEDVSEPMVIRKEAPRLTTAAAQQMSVIDELPTPASHPPLSPVPTPGADEKEDDETSLERRMRADHEEQRKRALSPDQTLNNTLSTLSSRGSTPSSFRWIPENRRLPPGSDPNSPNLLPKPPRSPQNVMMAAAAANHPKAPELREYKGDQHQGGDQPYGYQTLLRLSGPTNYPVLTPYVGAPPPSPARKTAQMQFMKPDLF